MGNSGCQCDFPTLQATRILRPYFRGLANEGVWELQGDALKRVIAQTGGTDDDATGRIASTFAALAKVADFKAQRSTLVDPKVAKDDGTEADEFGSDRLPKGRVNGLRAEFQYVIQVQLPSNGTEETYLNISTLSVRLSNEQC